MDAALVRHPTRQGVRPAVVLGNGALAEVVDCALTVRAVNGEEGEDLEVGNHIIVMYGQAF